MVTLKLSASPKKATHRKFQWTTNKPGTLAVEDTSRASCEISGKKTGTATVTAKAKDGSGKKATLKVKVTGFIKEATPTPQFEKQMEGETETLVEDFEKYAPGTKWDRYTSGGFANSGTMTVVQDPEDPSNKVLKIEYNGTDQAYDFAPIFSLALPGGSRLGDYVAVRMKSRMVCNTAECNYKKAYCFFDTAGSMTQNDFFATELFTGTNPAEAETKYRFGVNLSMAEGEDKNYVVPDKAEPGNAIQDEKIIEASKGKRYNNKNFPTYYDEYATGDKDAVSPGYSEEETTAAKKAGFQQNTLLFDTARIRAAKISGADTTPLLERNTLDMALGSTYLGSQGKPYASVHMTLYLDDIRMVAGRVACEKMEFLSPPSSLKCGSAEDGTEAKSIMLKIGYTPTNTTQREVTYTSSDPSLATVDASGQVTANSDGKTGSVVITATNVQNPAVSVSTTIEVRKKVTMETDYDVLTAAGTSLVPKQDTSDTIKVSSNTDTFTLDKAAGTLAGTFNANETSVVLDLGAPVDVSDYEGVEIKGVADGQIALELYGDGFDMTKTKENGAAEDWWETASGMAYPFYVGSCAWRYERGGMNTKRVIAEGFTWPNGAAKPTEETKRYSLNRLGTKGSGAWDKIRYIVIKTVQNPYLAAPEKGTTFTPKTDDPNAWVEEFDYRITGLKFLKDPVLNTDAHYEIDVEKNRAETDGAKASWYIDRLTDAKPAEKRLQGMNLSDCRYLCVKVTGSGAVKAGLVAEGKKLADAVEIGADDGTAVSGDRWVYFSLAHMDKELLLRSDAVSVETADGMKVTGLSLTKGEIGYEAAAAKVDVRKKADGDGFDVKVVTEAEYGTETAPTGDPK